MSNIGKTLLKGHALRYEGRRRFDASGLYDWHGEYAACECGLLSEPWISQPAARSWHREHKDSLRGEA